MAVINSTAMVATGPARRRRGALGRMLLAGSALGCTLLPVVPAAAKQIREISTDGAPVVIGSTSVVVPDGGGTGIEAETTGSITIDSGAVETDSALGHAIVARGGPSPVLVESTTARTRGAGANGIDVTTTGGDANIVSGDVQTSGAGKVYGISALTAGGAIAIQSSSVSVASTGADDGRGIHANSGGGDIVIDAGTTLGHSRAIFTTTLFSGPELGFSAGNTRITSESATATGGNAIIAQGYSVDLTSGRAEATGNAGAGSTVYVSAGLGGATVRADETIAHGVGHYGIYALSSGDLSIDSGLVSTDSQYGNGISALGSAAITLDSDSVVTAGADSHGINVTGYTSFSADPVTINSGTIDTAGNQSNGIYIASFTEAGGMTGDITIDSGTIEATGGLSHGIVVASTADPGYQYRPVSARAGTGLLTIDSNAIAATGAGGRGIVLDHAGAIAINSGSIQADAGGIYMWAGSTVDIISETVTTPNGPGIVVYGGVGDITLNAGTTTVGTGGDVGVWARSTEGDISITAGTTTTARKDIFAGMYTADGVTGISAGGGDVSVTAHSTAVAGLSAWGVTALTSGAAMIDADIVTTTGDEGVGIFGRGDMGGVRITSGDVTTSGLNAHGIQAVSTSGNIEIDSTGSIGIGSAAAGIHARSTSGNIDVAVHDIAVQGDGIGLDLATTDGGNIALTVSGNVSLSGSGRTAAAMLGGTGEKRVTVAQEAVLFGTGSGIVSQRGTLLLDNSGTIRGNGIRPTADSIREGGVRLQSAAIVNNSGTIAGTEHGIITTQLLVPNPEGGFMLTWSGVDTEVNNSGSIIGENDDGVAIYNGGAVRNRGLITGGGVGDGIQLQWLPATDSGREQIGSIVNEAGGFVGGSRYGIILAGGGTIDNAGEIEGGTGGVVLVNQNFADKTGALTNSGAIHSNDGFGILLNLDSVQVENSGKVEAGGAGIYVEGGNFSLVNSGTILSAGDAVQTAGIAQLANSGSIQSSGLVGVRAGQGGIITNTGAIFGAGSAIAVGGATILDNAGALGSNSGTAVVLSDLDDSLILRTGSAIQGAVAGGGGIDTATLIGTNAQPGADQRVGRLDGFESLTVESGYWGTSGYVGEFASVQIGRNGALQVNELADSQGVSPIDTLDVRNDGLLAFNYVSEVAVDSETPLAISGTGAVALVGSGTVRVETDTLTHSGGTIVSNGALVLTGTLGGNVTTTGDGVFTLGDGGTSGTFTGDLINDGTFIYARLDDYDFTGAFSGEGALEKRGAGTLTFSGDYNFVGTTTILGGSVKFAGAIDPSTEFDLSNGTLDLSGGDQTIGGLSGSGESVVAIDGSQLTVNQDKDTVFAGAITGNGGLTLTGGGELNLTGNSSYTGVTSVQDGKLKVNGAIVSTVTLAPGGSLGGNGKVGSTTVNGGRLEPGNSIGRLTVDGNLSFGAASVYEVEANAAGEADRLDVTGATTINGAATVQVLAEDGAYDPRTDYTILTSAGGITGTFGSITSNLAFLTPRLSYAANTVTLSLFRNDIRFAAVAATSNQAAVANAVEGLGVDSDLYEEVLVQSAAGARSAYDSLSGEIHATTSAALANDARLVREAMVASVPDEDAAGLFTIASLTGNWGSVDPSAGAAGADLDQRGLVAGLGYAGGGLSLGVAGTIGKSDQQVDALASNASAESWGLSGIVGYATGGLQVQAGVGYAWHDVDTSRTTRVGALGDRLNGRYDATTRQLFANLSYDIGAGAIDLAPFASIANVRVTTGSFAETGGATALSVARGSQDSSFLTLGADARAPLAATVSATLRGGWQHGWGDLAATSIARLPGSAAFRVDGIRLPQDAALLDAGLEAEVGPMRIGASYTGSYASGWTQHGARLTATIRF